MKLMLSLICLLNVEKIIWETASENCFPKYVVNCYATSDNTELVCLRQTYTLCKSDAIHLFMHNSKDEFDGNYFKSNHFKIVQS